MSEGLWSPFSIPGDAPSPALMSALTDPWARSVVAMFLERRRASLPGDLTSLLERWVGRPEDGAFVWHPSLGLLHLSATSGVPAPVDCAALAGAYILATGVEGGFDVELSAPQSILWDRLLLPPARRVRVASTATAATIELDPGSSRSVSVELVRTATGWADVSRPAGEPDGVTILGSGSMSDDVSRRFDVLEEAPLVALDDGVTSTFRAAVAVLRDVAPDYLEWARRILTAVAVVSGEAHRVLSGSNKDVPGLVYISRPAHPTEIAEMLVHEASHQYFYLVTRAADVDDGTDQTIYWSGAARAERSIDRILLAYHAFANVLLFYERCAARGLDEPVVRKNQRHIGRIVGDLDSCLRKTSALTALGHGLYRPLAARLAPGSVPGG
jgi:HEXXH motif-containing protein